MFKKERRIDLKLLIFIFLFMVISVITIHSSMLYLPSYLGNLALKQGIWYLIGFITIIGIILIPINYKYHLCFYLFNLLLLIIVLFKATPINGSKCWLIIGSFSIQPSEFMKISLIITVSKIVGDWSKDLPTKIRFKDETKLLLRMFLVLLPPTVLTFSEPDTGAVIIYMVIVFSILFISPLRKRWFLLILVILVLLIGITSYFYFFDKSFLINNFPSIFYRINRLLDWRNGSGMQLENSLTAIGSAGLMGHGYMKTPIYFPESGTDFIFSVFASNFGLIGSISLFIFLILFDIYLIDIGRKTTNITDKYIIVGTLSMFLYQQLQNIGMTLGILPITGITLPFISYGGSSLIAYMLIIGIIIKMKKKY